MKRYFSLVSLLLLLNGCVDITIPEPENVNHQPVDKSVTAHLDIKNQLAYFPEDLVPFSGVYETYYENGNKSVEMHYQHGFLSGPMLQWYETGDKKFEGHYIHGKADGVFTSWDPNGLQTSEICYSQGYYCVTINHAKSLLKAKLYKPAFWVFQQLAEQNNRNAQFHLAYMYQHGLGTPKDPHLAHTWYHKVSSHIAHKVK